jgi:hypothetical protein
LTELEEDLKRDLAHLRLREHELQNELGSIENQLRERETTIEGLKTILEAQSRLLQHLQDMEKQATEAR